MPAIGAGPKSINSLRRPRAAAGPRGGLDFVPGADHVEPTCLEPGRRRAAESGRIQGFGGASGRSPRDGDVRTPTSRRGMLNRSKWRGQPMAMHQINPQGGKLATLDPIWERIRSEAEDIVRREPELATFIYSTVLHPNRPHDSFIH